MLTRRRPTARASADESHAMTDSTSRTYPEFDGKVVVVTGGSAGIGRAIASAFAHNGAKVIVAGRNFEAASRAVAEIARDAGAQALAVQTDVGVPEQCDALIDAAVKHFGAVDILVNNAAYFAPIPLLDVSAEDSLRFLDINFRGPLFCGRALARWATANRRPGVIVNVSSISGARPAPGCGLYSATKAALNSLTKSMALEWSPKRIRVNGVAPGHVDTEGVKEDFKTGRLDYEAMIGAIPARRIAAVSDIADIVLFLASERSRHVAGATVTIDGGESL
jgi:NAD(P)-dependent dehydrogenase (short-subunit alcohol dehydrogenase family)